MFPDQAVLPGDGSGGGIGSGGVGTGGFGSGGAAAGMASGGAAGSGGSPQAAGADAGTAGEAGAPRGGGDSGGADGGATDGGMANGGSAASGGSTTGGTNSSGSGGTGGTLPCANPTRVELAAVGDAHIALLGGGKSGNFGGEAYLRVASPPNEEHALLAFDLSAIAPASVVVSARLRLTLATDNALARQVAAHGVSRAWREDKVTWADATPSTEWTTPGGDVARVATTRVTVPVATAGRLVEWDVASDVQADVDLGAAGFGWLLRHQAGAAGALAFASREAVQSAWRPHLLVLSCP